jgi:hypothetical protein
MGVQGCQLEYDVQQVRKYTLYLPHYLAGKCKLQYSSNKESQHLLLLGLFVCLFATCYTDTWTITDFESPLVTQCTFIFNSFVL